MSVRKSRNNRVQIVGITQRENALHVFYKKL